MASILKVNTIQDATNSNTAVTIDSSGNVSIPGAVVQIQNATLAGGANTTTSTSFIDTGVTVNITPKFATSKIFIAVHQAMSLTASTNTRIDFRCIESGGTEVYRMDYHGNDSNNVGTIQRNLAGTGVFQCSNTNQLTFKTQVQKAGPIANEVNTIYYDWYTGSIHTIVAMEIAQ